MTSGVYQIRNLVNDHCYVGSSKKIEWRWEGHLEDLRLKRHYNQHLQNAFSKHGESAFVFETLEVTNDLIPREQHYIDALRPEYNMCPRAGSSHGVKLGPPQRRVTSKE